MKKKTLTFKLVAGGIVAVLVPLLFVGIFASIMASNALEKEAKAAVGRSANALADKVQGMLLMELNVAKGIAVNSAAIAAVTTGKADGLNQFLSDTMVAVGEAYESIVITNAEGIIVADSKNGSLKGVSLAERDYVQLARAGKANIGTAVISKLLGSPVSPLAAPVMKNGQVVGVVAFALKNEVLSEKIAKKYGETGYSFMSDKSCTTIAHVKKENVMTLDNISKVQGMETIAKMMLAGQSGVQSYNFRGTEKVAGVAQVPLTGWSVVVTQNRDEFLAQAHFMRNVIILAVVIFIVATSLVVLFFARGISASIKNAAVQMNEAANQVSAASGEVSAASQSLAESTSEQASSIEETSSSLEELSAMTKQNADHAVQANSLMKQSEMIVQRANDSLDGLTHAMKEISDASSETSKIIKTIDEIAFQTNLLALNAAVEAARAGEAGAGFAVVAEEVRNLAMRAADAAKNTAGLIEGTVDKIKGGSDLVDKTNEAFSEVAVSSLKVAELIAGITVASQEQAQGIDQINRAVAEMEKVTQMNAANAEESAAASEEMNAQAEQMAEIARVLSEVVGGDSKDVVSNQSAGARKGMRLFGSESGMSPKKEAVKKSLPYHGSKSKGPHFD